MPSLQSRKDVQENKLRWTKQYMHNITFSSLFKYLKYKTSVKFMSRTKTNIAIKLTHFNISTHKFFFLQRTFIINKIYYLVTNKFNDKLLQQIKWQVVKSLQASSWLSLMSICNLKYHVLLILNLDSRW